MQNCATCGTSAPLAIHSPDCDPCAARLDGREAARLAVCSAAGWRGAPDEAPALEFTAAQLAAHPELAAGGELLLAYQDAYRTAAQCWKALEEKRERVDERRKQHEEVA